MLISQMTKASTKWCNSFYCWVNAWDAQQSDGWLHIMPALGTTQIF